MREFLWTENLWRTQPHRLLLAVGLAAMVGVAGGRTVLAIAGSVSVVDGKSMAPTYQPGTRVLTEPISKPLERGDIVLVDDGSKDYALKRIVGMPGETVQFWRGYVFIDQMMLREPYLPKFTYTFPDERTQVCTFKLAEGQYFVLGDNRLCSFDSRNYGPVARKQIKGHVPMPEHPLRAEFAAYTLPASGKRTIRPL
jgi:signal peptidase I